MARTYNDIYYNDDENSTAEILDDMKKLAESVDQQIGSIKSFNNDTSQFIEQVTPLMNTLSEQVIDMHQLADTMFTELEQVKEENKQLREDLNGLPKGQASGESIDLSDSAEMRCELKISGNSVQEGEPTPDEPVEVECCGDNINIFDGEVEEGNIDASTGQNTAVTNAWRSKNYLNVKDTSVSISVKDLTFSGTVGRLYFYKSDNTYISNILINSLPFTATLPNKTAKVRFFILNSVADINAKIKLEKGSTATPYSPYGQGCINEVISNYKNLFIKGKGIVIGKFLSSDGSIGTDTSLFYQEDYIEVTGGTQMIISAENKENFRIVEYDSNKTFIRRDLNEGGAKTYTITLPSNCRYIRVSTTLANLDSLIIQEGSTIANNQSQTYTIPTQQPFRAIGNVRDKFILKENGKWYERHYIARKIFDGTENFNLGTNANSLIYFFTDAGSIKAKSQDLLCNKLTTVTNLWNETKNKDLIAIRSALDLFNIMLSDTTINTVDLFKSYLQEQYNAGTPVYVDYVLATPTDIECTEEQSTILFDIEQNAKTYDKVTHMYSTDNVSPVIDVTYKKDIETLFANTLVEGV